MHFREIDKSSDPLNLSMNPKFSNRGHYDPLNFQTCRNTVFNIGLRKKKCCGYKKEPSH